MADNRAIGVFDSGLGGLTVVKELRSLLTDEDIVYFGDTGRVPYGTKSRETIRKYAVEDEKFLLSKNVKLIIAACGTVSSVASDIGAKLPVPYFEVVSHSAVSAVNETKNKKIGVIGTAATINSGMHKKLICELLPEAEVTACSCSMFVPLVEEGWFTEDDAVVLGTARRYLKPMVESKVDTLILGCTHYPILSKAIDKVLNHKVKLINMGTSVALSVAKYLKENDMLSEENKGECTFYVSDKPDNFRNTASILLGNDFDEQKVEQVDLNSL